MKPTPSLDAHWMPFTANRQFKQNPHLISRAEGAYLYDQQGRRLFDSLSGLWCCGLGHTRTEITQAVTEQMGRLDYSPAFQVGHELSFELANRLVEKTPAGLNKVFFTCSGSEAADTALKMARAYWRMMGQATKTRFIGRGKGYHGVNFGGLSVGGIGANRKLYGNMLEADHLNHTWLPENAFSRGLPAYGAHLANELEEIIALNDASNIAAVIVEPFAGSGGVIVPPQGYLQRLRELCNQYNILLIFDEVITGFYRTGQCFGAQTFGVTPDIINVAKGLTNAAIPQGAVIAHEKIYNAFMEANLPLHAIEFPHGYTYSAHPVACAAGIAAMQLYDSEHIEAKVNDLIPYFENALHQLKGLPHLEDLRNCGLAGAIQLAARQGDGTIRPRELFESCWQQGLYLRYGGNNISLAPPFISEKSEIDQMFNILADEIRKLK